MVAGMFGDIGGLVVTTAGVCSGAPGAAVALGAGVFLFFFLRDLLLDMAVAAMGGVGVAEANGLIPLPEAALGRVCSEVSVDCGPEVIVGDCCVQREVGG